MAQENAFDTLEQVAPVKEDAAEVVLQAGTPMERLTLVEFCKLHKLPQFVHLLRHTTNGVPYITFINEYNRSKNIVFSRNAGAILEENGVEKGDTVSMDMLNSFKFMWSQTNAAEEGYAWKIVSAKEGASNRTNVY